MIHAKASMLGQVLLIALSPAVWGQTRTTDPAPSPPPVPVVNPAAITITGPSTVPANTLAIFTVSGASSVAWLTIPDTSQLQIGTTLAFTAAPGTYTVIAMAIVGGQPAISKVACTFQGPTPDPTPTPNPTPTATATWAIGIFDPSLATDPVFTSQTLGPRLAAMGYNWRAFLSTDDILSQGGTRPISGTVWGIEAKKQGKRALVMASDDGSMVGSASVLPTSEAAVVAALTKGN